MDEKTRYREALEVLKSRADVYGPTGGGPISPGLVAELVLEGYYLKQRPGAKYAMLFAPEATKCPV